MNLEINSEIFFQTDQLIFLSFLIKLESISFGKFFCTAKKFILVCVDRCSKFPSAQITSSTSAKSIIRFLSNYIALHGIPKTIWTDQGSGFISKEVREFCLEHDIKVIFSPVGDHRATGLVERLIRTIKERQIVMAQEHPKPSLETALPLKN